MERRLNLSDEERRARKRQQDRASHQRQILRPGYHERKRELDRAWRKKAYPNRSENRKAEPRCEPPPEVIAERDRVYYAIAFDPIAILLGDPRPGRRAIDQRMARS